jgi:hypothetical protein
LGKLFESITPELATWVERQHLFFVATAPAGAEGHVNCSPKGLDTLRILDPNRVAYLDLTGSGAETIAHIRDNGRIVFMFCALDGPPKIVRFHGSARIVTPDDDEWTALRAKFPAYPGARTIIVADLSRISDSCGFGVPRFEYVEERDTLERWAENKGEEGLPAYRSEKNARSIDGLPALEAGG